MFVLTVIAFTALLLSPASTAKPKEFKTMTVSYAPDKALVINEGDSQMFRAPMCKGQYLDKWSFVAKVYMMNVPWDSAEVGDDSWLHIKISNGPEMTKIVRDNARDAGKNDPQPLTKAFTYNKATWGSDDIYIQITASQGNPTFQYGLELIGTTPRDDLSIPDGMDGVETVSANQAQIRNCGIEVLEQIANPLTSKLVAEQTGQYLIPFCFEDQFDQRTLTVSTMVPESLNKKPGGVASFFCTTPMMKNGICWRSTVTNRGATFYDPSGAKVNSVTPTVVKDEYGAVYLLVLAQGDYQETVEFTITTKLRNPPKDTLKLTGHSEKDLHSVLSYLKTSYENKAAPLDPSFEPHELKEEL
ncbi:hypothetical protein ACHWQZ_G000097 [Mnemiopsis leidyi]